MNDKQRALMHPKTIELLKKIRNYGGVHKFIEQHEDTLEVAFVTVYQELFQMWDKENIAFK